MHPARALAVLLLLSPLGAGCTVLRYAHRVCIQEPELFCEPKDDRASLATYRALADEVWATQGADCPEGCLAGDYSWGFREGFAQYVYAGGTGEPPAVPPRPYWQLDLRSQEGAAAVNSWFEGYRLGSQIARDGGYRKTATIQVSASLEDCDACGCPDRGTIACPIDASAQPLPELVPFAPELLIPGTPLPDPESDQPVGSGVDGSGPGPSVAPRALLSPGDEGVAPPELEARTISAIDEPGDPKTAIFQIVR